jgi:hypothetical protein
MEPAFSAKVDQLGVKQENRVHPRRSERMPFRIRRLGSGSWEFDAVCTDHSENGIGADVAAVFSVGEVLELCWDGAEHTCQARVVYRVNGSHYGMCFLK